MTYPDPIITNTAIIFDLKKPIYGSVFSIYDKWLKIAKARDLIMIVKTPFGKATYRNADEWLSGAERIEKPHYFKEPMIMFAKSVLPDIRTRLKRKKIEKKIEMSSNAVMSGLARLKRQKPELFADVRIKLGLG